jgi:hypothetical protein
MPVQPQSLDVLEKAGVPAPQARAIVQAIEIEIDGAQDAVATKHDVLRVRQEVEGLRQELHQEVAGLRQELHQEVAGLRQELHQESAGLRKEMVEMRHGLELKIEILRGELRSEIHASASSTTRQMYMALLGQMAVLLGIAYFFVTHVTR